MKENWINNMRRKLEGHQMDPPPGLWEDISKQMDKPFGLKPLSRLAGTAQRYWAAAAAVLALVGFFVSQQPTSEQRTPEQTVSKQPASQQLADKSSVEQEPQAKAPLLAHVRHQAPVAESKTETKAEVLPESDSPAEIQQTPDEPKQTADDSQRMPDEPQQASVEPQQTTNLSQKAEWPDDLQIPESNDVQKQNKWSVGLKASGGLLAVGTPRHSDSPGSHYAINPQDTETSDNQNQSEMPDVYNPIHQPEHHLPIRFGVSMNYQLTPRIALYSGISYTYLYSEFGTFDQKLHYLGVPLGVSWQLWSARRFLFYLSGGMMLEKCVSAETDESSTSKKPWQWSVSAAAGAEYNFIPQLGFYLEPSLGYYFDDGTPLKHYYMKHPLALTIEFGLRLHLNE